MKYHEINIRSDVVATTDEVTGIDVTRPYTTAETATADARAITDASETTRVGLDTKVRAAVAKDGTLDTDLGTAVAWTPGTPLTLRGWKAMSAAQMKALTLVQTQELLTKLAPLIVDMAVSTKRVGKMTLGIYDDAT
jgi:hypothetical protein